MQGWYHKPISINLIYHINKSKEKSYIIILIDAGNAFEKTLHPFLIKKTIPKVVIEGTYLNIIKPIYGKPTANIILSGEKLKAFPLSCGSRQGCPLYHFYSA